VFPPKALAFVAILIIGWLIAKAVRKLVDKILERVGFDHLVERGGVKTALQHSKYDASDIVYAIVLFTLQLAFGIWGPNPISALITAVVAWIPRAFVAIIIVVVASAIAKAVKDLITASLGGQSYGRILATIASVFILGLGIIAALNQIGVATTVTTPILITVLAIIGGVIIVVGDGLVRPVQNRWDGWLDKAQEESAKVAVNTRAYRDAPTTHQPAPTQRPQPIYPTVTEPAEPTVGLPNGSGAHRYWSRRPQTDRGSAPTDATAIRPCHRVVRCSRPRSHRRRGSTIYTPHPATGRPRPDRSHRRTHPAQRYACAPIQVY
jgi:hypothetical protein